MAIKICYKFQNLKYILLLLFIDLGDSLLLWLFVTIDAQDTRGC